MHVHQKNKKVYKLKNKQKVTMSVTGMYNPAVWYKVVGPNILNFLKFHDVDLTTVGGDEM